MSGNTGFQFKYNLAGRTSGIIRKYIIANSATIAVGDMVKLSGGYIALAGANAPVLGCVVGLVDVNGIDLDNSTVTKEGTYSATNKAYTADSDNTTSEQASVLVDIDPFSVYSATPDNTIGTTTGSNLAGYYCDVPAASDQPDEDTTTTTVCQLFIHGLDPENSSNGLYSIAEHQIWGQ